jgi:hypothetical protein
MDEASVTTQLHTIESNKIEKGVAKQTKKKENPFKGS